jgi:plasmid maintenance system antidote protein VapI
LHSVAALAGPFAFAARDIAADTDLRVARDFGVSDGFFLSLQTDYDLMQRRRQIGDKLKAVGARAA